MTQIDLVTGFLGAGKTTFILKYCDYLKRQGKSFAIVENEFAQNVAGSGIDVSILKNQGIDVVELSGGCICCSLKIDFVYALINLSKKYDHIIVEPSGIFTLEDFYEAAFAPEVQACCEIGTVVTIVDEQNLLNMNDDDKNVFISQMHSTGAVIASKTNADNEEYFISSVSNLMDDLLGYRWELSSDAKSFFVLDWNDLTDEIFKKIQKCTPQEIHTAKTPINHAMIFQSTTLYPNKAFDLYVFKNTMRQIFTDDYGNVLRVKGYIKDLSGNNVLINCTKTTYNLTTIDKSQMDTSESIPTINIIGRNLNRKAINALLV